MFYYFYFCIYTFLEKKKPRRILGVKQIFNVKFCLVKAIIVTYIFFFNNTKLRSQFFFYQRNDLSLLSSSIYTLSVFYRKCEVLSLLLTGFFILYAILNTSSHILFSVATRSIRTYLYNILLKFFLIKINNSKLSEQSF